MRGRTIFLAFLIWTTEALDYEIELITNPILPELKGTSFIINDRYTLHYHINVTNIISCLKQIETTAVYLNRTIHESKTTEMSHIVLSKLNHTFAVIGNLKNLLNHYSNAKPISRRKRGLINIIGTTQKWLFGTLDAEDGTRYDNYIRILRNNQNILNKDLNSQKLVLEKLTQTLDSQLKIIENNQIKILNKLKDLDLKDKSLFTTMYTSFLNDNINLQLSQVETTCNNIQTAINFAQTGIMHYSILKYTDLSRILKEIKKDRIIPFDNIIKYYETMHAQVTIQKDLIIFTIHIPLIEGTPFLLYKIYPIPILNRTISTKHSYVLSSTTNYFTMDNGCPLIENYRLCMYEKLSKEDQCLYLMLNLKGQCPTIPITYKRKSITPLSDNSLLIIPKKEQIIEFQCPNQKSIEIINQPSIIFPRNCQTIIDEFKFSKQNTEVIDLRFKLPTVHINISHSYNEPLLEVEEIDHSLINQAKGEIKALKIHNMQNLSYNYSYWKEATIIALMLILVISIVLMFLYLFQRKIVEKKTRNVDIDIELRDTPVDLTISEKPTAFSET